jgi:hypothetical protein
MGRSLALNEAGQHVSLWHARITGAIERYKRGEPEREQLRQMVSEITFPPLMAPPAPITGGDQGSLEYAHVDQIDMNLMLRYVNKLKAHAGDEQPKVTVPRGLGREKIARLEDALLQRIMSESGANEALLDAIGLYSTDGNAATWVFMPHLPTVEAMLASSKDIDQIIAEAEAGVAEPAPGQDHKAIAAALMEASLGEPKDAAVERATADPMMPSRTGLLRQAAIKYAAAADEAEKQGHLWRSPLGKVVVEVQPMGEFGTLIDPLACDLKSARWVARRITMTGHEARNHDSFHPRTRKHLKPEPVDSSHLGGDSTRIMLADNEQMDEENGLVVVWEVWDRENNARYYVNMDVNLYLQADEQGPYGDETGESVIKPIGTHPGWFPVVCEPLMKPVRRSPQQIDGIPLLKPGKPQQLEIIKMISAMSGAVKRASAGIYLHRGLDPEMVKLVAQGVDGTMVDCDEVDPDINLKEALTQVEWKAPSHELFRQIDNEIARFAIAMNFPLAEITSQPMADTATQEEIGLAQGSLGITEILRRLEVHYGHQVWIAQSFVAAYYTNGAVAQVGGPEATQVREAWQTQGRLPELPAIKLAAKAKEANPVRVRQLMELYTTASQIPDPMSGFPKYDVEHLLLEAAETLGIGNLPLLEVTPEMIEMRLLEQESQAAEGGEGGVPSPKTPSGEKSEGPDTKDQKKPQPRGSQESSAARRTDS